MARVTVEDCVDKVQNRFELVVLTAKRSKDINAGAPITVERDNDKYPVIALRELAAGNIKPEVLREEVLSSYRLRKAIDVIPEDLSEITEVDDTMDFLTNVSSYSVEENLSEYGDGMSFEDELNVDEEI